VPYPDGGGVHPRVLFLLNDPGDGATDSRMTCDRMTTVVGHRLVPARRIPRRQGPRHPTHLRSDHMTPALARASPSVAPGMIAAGQPRRYGRCAGRGGWDSLPANRGRHPLSRVLRLVEAHDRVGTSMARLHPAWRTRAAPGRLRAGDPLRPPPRHNARIPPAPPPSAGHAATALIE
jgi:hypothetical protein